MLKGSQYFLSCLFRLITVTHRSTADMSGGLDALSMTEDDVKKILASTAHLGSNNIDFQMEQYSFKRKLDGKYGTAQE